MYYNRITPADFRRRAGAVLSSDARTSRSIDCMIAQLPAPAHSPPGGLLQYAGSVQSGLAFSTDSACRSARPIPDMRQWRSQFQHQKMAHDTESADTRSALTGAVARGKRPKLAKVTAARRP